MFTQLTNFYHSIPPAAWKLLWSALILSGVMEGIKHLAVKDVGALSTKTQTALVAALAFASSGIQQLLSSAAVNPGLLGQHTILLVGAMHALYTFGLKPAVNLLKDARAYRAQTPSAPANGGAAG